MRRIFLFMNVTLDGYFEGLGHDLSWSHTDFEAFSAEGSRNVDTILLGHTTYDMMKAFWPTAQAQQVAPEVAKFMNGARKVVASHKPFDAGWSRVTVLSDDVARAVRRLKAEPGGDIIILGSNNLSVSLMQEGLIDEFQINVNPVALGAGTSLFKGLTTKVELRLRETHPFKSGAVLLVYEPAVR